MPAVERRAVRFVRALLPAATARLQSSGDFVVGGVTLGANAVRELISAGVLSGDAESCRASPEARGWLKRQLLDEDAFAAQHRLEARTPEGAVLNLAESPLARLAAPAAGEGTAFLARHQVEAGERVRRLAERAQLQPRVTMSYSATHTAGGKGLGHAADIGDMAAEARKALRDIPRLLPRDCADVVLDVCGLLKGLQVVESERGWPRRSAKLVLRIGLEQLAQHYGYAPQAVGAESRRPHVWLDDGARPDVFEVRR
jgi:hypothetical protein